MPQDVEVSGLRIDRWLWCARFYKSRSAAAEAVKGGHIHVNGERVKPSRSVQPGDALTISRNQTRYEVVVETIPERRGPAPEARACYTETEASMARREAAAEQRAADRLGQRAPTPGRPDKRTRRLMRNKRPGS